MLLLQVPACLADAADIRLDVHGGEEVLEAGVAQLVADCAKVEHVLERVLHKEAGDDTCRQTWGGVQGSRLDGEGRSPVSVYKPFPIQRTIIWHAANVNVAAQ